MKMVMRNASFLLFMGIAIDLMGTVASVTVIKTLLYGTESRDREVLLLVCIVVAIIGLLAAFLRALRADEGTSNRIAVTRPGNRSNEISAPRL